MNWRTFTFRNTKLGSVMDTLGLLIVVLITGANVDDGTAAPEVLAQMSPEDFPRLETIFGDNKYHHKKLEAWLKQDRPQWKAVRPMTWPPRIPPPASTLLQACAQ